MWTCPLVGVTLAGDLPFRRIVLISDEEEEDDDDEEDRPADEEKVFFCRVPTDRSDCQSMPCCFLSCAKDSRRASRSSLDFTILSG